jgi:alpha/beta superfamily hydrolase
MDFKDLKTKPDEIKKIAKNFKEWYDEQQPKERCDMIKGHDNYWEGKIEEIKKIITDFDKSWMHNSHDPTQKMMDDIKKILES